MASFCAPFASSSSAEAADVMAAVVITTSAAPSITIRILFSFFCADFSVSLDGTPQLANHFWFD
jgi:hypothetical protein